MSLFWIIVLAIVGFIIWAVSSSNAAAAREAEARRLEREREETFASNRRELIDRHLADWPIRAIAKIDGALGMVAMNGDGSELRIVTCRRENVEIEVIDEETISTSQVTTLAIDQPSRPKTVTHRDKVPVAVGSGRSSVGRAVVGGVVAGPAGAVVGSISGLGGKSQIEDETATRSETIYVKGHPKLIVGVDDLVRPRRVLEFETVTETNDWSSRIYNAMKRARGKR